MGQRVAGEAALGGGVERETTGSVAKGSEPRADGERPAMAVRPVHRLRDLGRRERRWAAAVAAALALAPLAAFLIFLPKWAPTGDPALMGLRALDVGTSRTPLLGQPSTSGMYAESARHIHHPGALHFYLMAVPVRLLGGPGMILVSVLITGTCLLTSAWAIFRQLGRSAGLLAACILAAIAFTTGAGSLVNPVSSSIAGYPLLLSTVLLWCVACGDLRLLPAATAAVSFTAQVHLSVVPATLVVTLGGVSLFAVSWWRQGRWRRADERRRLARAAQLSGLTALALWAPALAQQIFGNIGNLGEMIWFARNDDKETLGFVMATRPLAHTLGLPPLLGRTDLSGQWLLSLPSPTTWMSAGAVAGVVVLLGLRWRRPEPRRAMLVAMAGVVVVAGIVNGASVPIGQEQYRLAFYHWTHVLTLFVALALGLAVVDAVRRRLPAQPPARSRAVRRLLAGAAVVLVAAPSLVNPVLDRRTNTLARAHAQVHRRFVESITDVIVAHRDELGDHTVLLSRNEPLFGGTETATAFALADAGLDVRQMLYYRYYVDDDRLVDRDEVDGGILLAFDLFGDRAAPVAGRLLAEVPLTDGFDGEAYNELVARAEAADEVRLGPEMERGLADLPEGYDRVMIIALRALIDDPGTVLANPAVLELLRDHPLEYPALDPALVERVLDGRPDATKPYLVRVYLLDRDEVLDTASTREIGRP